MSAASRIALIAALSIAGCGGRARVALPRPTTPLAATPEDALGAPPEATSSAPASLVAPTVVTLANGLSLVIVERHELPVVAFSLASRSSGRDDADAVHGIDTLFEWVMSDAAQDAAGLMAEVSLPSTNVYTRGAEITYQVDSRGMEAALRAIATLARAPNLSAEAVARERRALDREIGLTEGSLSIREERHLDELLYGASDPRALPWWGERSTFRRLDRDAIVARHAALFVPSASALVIVGDVDPAAVRALAEETLGDWSTPPRETRWLPPPTFADPAARLHGLPVSGHESSVHLREQAPPWSHPDRAGFEMLTALLGGMFGSRINMTLREERGHTYGVHAVVSSHRDHGVLDIELTVAGSTTRSTIFALVNELRRLSDAAQIEEDEVEHARAHAIARLRSYTGSRAGTALTLSSAFRLEQPFDALEAQIARMATIDREELARIARAWLRPEHAPMVVVGEWEYLRYSMSFIPGGYEYIEPD